MMKEFDLEVVREVEAKLLSKHYDEVMSGYIKLKEHLKKSRDSIWITAIFIRLADTLESATSFTSILISKV